MADHQNIGVHSVECNSRINQRFPFLTEVATTYSSHLHLNVCLQAQEACVRVEASKNRLICVRPLSTGRFCLTCAIIQRLHRHDLTDWRCRVASNLDPKGDEAL